MNVSRRAGGQTFAPRGGERLGRVAGGSGAAFAPREAAPPPATVYVVDDDTALRASLAALLEGAGLRVRAFAGGAEFLAACTPLWTGCVLLDVAMPGLDGTHVHAALAGRGIDLPVVFLTAHGDIASAVRAIKAGALDYLTKPVDGGVLLERVRAALALDARQRAEQTAAVEAKRRFATLTPREREVMALAITGVSSKDIARQLGISFRTVEAHRGQVMRKMAAESLLGLAAMAAACGLDHGPLPRR
jgi:two-component system response regulator FixJ